MEFIAFLEENIGVIIACVIIFLSLCLQVGNIREWMVLMCAMAEDYFGENTGALKARAVYDAFLGKYKIISKIIPYSVFEIILNWALKKMSETISFDEEAALNGDK